MQQISRKYVYGYNEEEAVEEAARCIELQKRKMRAAAARFRSIFRAFIHEVKEGKYRRRLYKVIGRCVRAAGSLRTCLPAGEPV